MIDAKGTMNTSIDTDVNSSDPKQSPFENSKLFTMRSSYAPKSFSKSDLLCDDYLLAHEGHYRVYYAALGATPAPDAKLILVGLTPGFSQTLEAARLFRDTAPEIRSNQVLYDGLLREHVAFGGSMRVNLCRMLDDLGLARHLELPKSEDLFVRTDGSVAATSALVYPVFAGAELQNFGGGSKSLAEVPLFRRMLDELLAPRLLAAPSALIVPLGKASASGVRYLTDRGVVSNERVLQGFPHPSGANGHRKREFDERRDDLAQKLAAWFETVG